MSYQLQVENFIILTYSGMVGFDERMQAAEDLVKLVSKQKQQAKSLLVDCRKLENQMTEDDEEKFGKFIAKNPILSGLRKVALVHNVKHSPTPHLQYSAYANGLNIVPFHSYYDAKSWLDGSLP